ncbi:MAG TPA: SAM-dependent methyltransferase [Acidimicrobiales bacterium]|nr:SAM-dependent methyltransferase [Acidimicrobiales bacterium]
MSLVLYHPRFGYYASRVPGRGGDYRTSPSLTPMFGQLVARELQIMWEALGRPCPFWVIEAGAGRADLAAGAINAMREEGEMGHALRWRFVELFDRVRQWQVRRLGPVAEVAEWTSELGHHEPIVGCVLANEVLDNFPVHVLQVTRDGTVQELYVDLVDGQLAERLGPLSDTTLAEAALRAAEHLPNRSRFELCPAVDGWCRDAFADLRRGYLLVLDYGGVEPDLWLEYPEGTVAVHGPGDLSRSPLEDPGQKDITAGVNFSALQRAAGAAGFEAPVLCSQKDWLLSLGLAQMAEELDLAGLEAAIEGWVEEAALLQGQLELLLGLADPEGLGKVNVLRAAKDAPPPPDLQ